MFMYLRQVGSRPNCRRGYLHYVLYTTSLSTSTTDTREYEGWLLTSCAKTFDKAPLVFTTRSTVFIASRLRLAMIDSVTRVQVAKNIYYYRILPT